MMKGRLLPVSRVVLAAAALVALGCSALNSPLSPLAITIKLDSHQGRSPCSRILRAGDTLNATATVWNRTARPASFWFPTTTQVELLFYNEVGTLVLVYPEMRSEAVTRLELGPFEQRSYDFGLALDLRPGLYRVRAALADHSGPCAEALLILLP